MAPTAHSEPGRDPLERDTRLAAQLRKGVSPADSNVFALTGRVVVASFPAWPANCVLNTPAPSIECALLEQGPQRGQAVGAGLFTRPAGLRRAGCHSLDLQIWTRIGSMYRRDVVGRASSLSPRASCPRKELGLEAPGDRLEACPTIQRVHGKSRAVPIRGFPFPGAL